MAPAPNLAGPARASEDSEREPITTRRQFRRFRERPTIFVATAPTITAQLGQLGDQVERAFLTGARPEDGTTAGAVRWAGGELPEGWRHSERGHYLETDSPVFRFERTNGRPVELLRAASWFGDEPAEVEEYGAAWAQLGELVAATFGPAAKLLSTPSATGRHLFLMSIPEGKDWPVMSADLQELVRSTSGQGRIELTWRGGELPALHTYDGRWSYAALCKGLPFGIPGYDRRSEFEGYRRARYRVAVTVPAGWDHVGLLPAHGERGSWRWPSEPGEYFDTWADGCEVGLALKHGWQVRIRERLLFAEHQGAGRGPLDTWADRLVRMRERAPGRLIRSAVRAMLLHTVGAFYGRPHRVTRAGDFTDVPEDAANWRTAGDTHLWAEDRGQAWPIMAHPEWSAAIWARARARLLDAPTGHVRRAGALHVPRSHVVGFRTDAIYLTERADWPDDGKVGRFRLTRSVDGPLPAPTSTRLDAHG